MTVLTVNMWSGGRCRHYEDIIDETDIFVSIYFGIEIIPDGPPFGIGFNCHFNTFRGQSLLETEGMNNTL